MESIKRQQRAIHWSDLYMTQNKQIDTAHKKILDGVIALYNLCADTLKNKGKIEDITEEIENALVEHMDKEIELMSELKLDHTAHANSHEQYKSTIKSYKKYKMPIAIKAVLISEVARDYMKNHFFTFDIKDIDKMNLAQKLKEKTHN